MTPMKQSAFIIKNMDCPTDEALVRKHLGAIPGVSELAFNLMKRKLTVTHTWADEQFLPGDLREIAVIVLEI